MTDVLMPRLSDSMQEGTILTWLVDDGGTVTAGQELAEIETDKATMTYEAEADGTLDVVAAAGTTVAVGDLIARVGADVMEDAGHHSVAERRLDAPLAAPGAVTASRATNGDAPAPAADPAPAATDDVAATPMARRIAAAHGVTLGELRGSGPRGRIVRADVMRAAGIAEPTPAPAPRSPSPPAPRATPAADGDERVAPTRLQATIARRMAEAKATVPHFQVQTDVEMTAALALREQLRDGAQARELAVPSLNDLVVKACALALRRFPRANGSYVDGEFVLHARVNVGIAVAAQDALVVPVIHDADTLALGEIAQRARELAGRVRDGSVTPPQLSGATFTVSNLGMYGMTAITPVVNPPQAAILGVGAIRDELTRAESGEIVDRRALTLTLSCDHRILYGADAAQFLGAVRDLLQSPHALVL